MKATYEGKMSEALAKAAIGHPHLIITMEKDGSAISEVTNGFDTDHIFGFIKMLAKADKDFAKELVNYVIDLSKEVK